MYTKQDTGGSYRTMTKETQCTIPNTQKTLKLIPGEQKGTSNTTKDCRGIWICNNNLSFTSMLEAGSWTSWFPYLQSPLFTDVTQKEVTRLQNQRTQKPDQTEHARMQEDLGLKTTKAFINKKLCKSICLQGTFVSAFASLQHQSISKKYPGNIVTQIPTHNSRGQSFNRDR